MVLGILIMEYLIIVLSFKEDVESFYFAFLPDFGMSACSFISVSFKETLEGLNQTFEDIYEFYGQDESYKPYSKQYSTEQAILNFHQFSEVPIADIKLDCRIYNEGE